MNVIYKISFRNFVNILNFDFCILHFEFIFYVLCFKSQRSIR